jgi:hypothetical protein
MMTKNHALAPQSSATRPQGKRMNSRLVEGNPQELLPLFHGSENG